MNRRGFFAWAGVVVAGVFTAWRTQRLCLEFKNNDGDWVEIPPLEGGGYLVPKLHADELFSMVEHPTLRTSTGGPVQVPRYNGKGAVFHE